MSLDYLNQWDPAMDGFWTSRPDLKPTGNSIGSQ